MKSMENYTKIDISFYCSERVKKTIITIQKDVGTEYGQMGESNVSADASHGERRQQDHGK